MLPVSNFDVSLKFYTDVLASIGVVPIKVYPGAAAGFGPKDGGPQFWIHTKDPIVNKIHVAFRAADAAAVQAFYDTALAAGGKDNGAPGPRAKYHPGFFGAFVFDPDGHNIEAVIHNYKA